MLKYTGSIQFFIELSRLNWVNLFEKVSKFMDCRVPSNLEMVKISILKFNPAVFFVT
ncbi:hypothetical protein [Methanobacterium aggregans]|uniref:hypothetical protein n=1 Tax=Methanobacterium aggregans TaxID=1615586 RepID=UPI001AE73855|nr:hypothetical protein [Methanobacterium aggregans]MBP2046979.1 hypothetical protein [Methanobacterium aggregans]